MLTIGLKLPHGDKLSVLCLGAHCDDIEIGCGAAMLRLGRETPDMLVDWVVFSSNQARAEEAEASAQGFLKDVKNKRVRVLEFEDGFLPYTGAQVKSYFESLKKEIHPDIILTHYRHDLHQDHRLISELTWNTFRDHVIWEYEIPKYDGDLGQPNLFIPVDEAVARRKASILLEHYVSQRDKPWFTETTFLGIMRVRGIECNSASGYAEAFFARKLVV